MRSCHFSRYRLFYLLSLYCVPHSFLLVNTDILLPPDNLMMPHRRIRGRGGGRSTTTSTRTSPSVSSTHGSAPYTLRSGRVISPVISHSLAASRSSSVTTRSSATTSSSTITHSATTTLTASGLLPAQSQVADLSVEDFLRVIRAVVQEDRASGPATSLVRSSSNQQSETSVTWSNTSSAALQPTAQHPPVVVSPRSQPAVQQG